MSWSLLTWLGTRNLLFFLLYFGMYATLGVKMWYDDFCKRIWKEETLHPTLIESDF